MDAYQQAVEYLTENPDLIRTAWSLPDHNPGGCLFRYASKSGQSRSLNCGCLTLIRSTFGFVAETDELTQAIRSDCRLPANEDKINADHLPIFAGWQRRIDKILGRTPPALDPRLPAPKGDIEIPAIELQIT